MIMLGGVEKPAPLQNLTPCFNISKRWIIMIHYDKVLSQSKIFSNNFQLYTEYVFLLQENYNVGLTEQLDPRSNRFPNSEITLNARLT